MSHKRIFRRICIAISIIVLSQLALNIDNMPGQLSHQHWLSQLMAVNIVQHWPLLITLAYITLMVMLTAFLISTTTLTIGRYFKPANQINIAIAVLIITYCCIHSLNSFLYPLSRHAWPLLNWRPYIKNVVLYFSGCWLFFNLYCSLTYVYRHRCRLGGGLLGITAVIWLFGYGSLHQPLAGATQRLTKQKQPNIAIFSLCSWNLNDMLTHTPSMNHFLTQSINYRRTFSPVARSFPSEITTLSGQYPTKSGLYFNLSATKNTPILKHLLPHQLQSMGYQTISTSNSISYMRYNAISNWGMQHRVDSNSDFYYALFSIILDTPLTNLLANTPIGWVLLKSTYGYQTNVVLFQENSFRNRLKLAINQATKSSQPFFLYVRDITAHLPYEPTKDTLTLPAPQRYLASMTVADKNFQIFLNTLNKKNLLNDTWVVLLSDHGEGLTNRDNYLQHAYSKYDKEYILKNKQNNLYYLRHGDDINAINQYKTLFGFAHFKQGEIDSKKQSITDLLPSSKIHGILKGLASTQHPEKNEKNQLHYIITNDGIPAPLTNNKIDIKKLKETSGEIDMDDQGQLHLSKAYLSTVLSHASFSIIQGHWQLTHFHRTKQAPFMLLNITTRKYALLKGAVDANPPLSIENTKRLSFVDLPKDKFYRLLHVLTRAEKNKNSNFI